MVFAEVAAALLPMRGMLITAEARASSAKAVAIGVVAVDSLPKQETLSVWKVLFKMQVAVAARLSGTIKSQTLPKVVDPSLPTSPKSATS